MLQGMPYISVLGILSVKCNTIQATQKSRQINEQSTKGKSSVNKNSNANTMVNGKHKYNIEYSVAGLERKANMIVSATKQYTEILIMYLQT